MQRSKSLSGMECVAGETLKCFPGRRIFVEQPPEGWGGHIFLCYYGIGNLQLRAVSNRRAYDKTVSEC